MEEFQNVFLSGKYNSFGKVWSKGDRCSQGTTKDDETQQLVIIIEILPPAVL
jgi:hypothetical protein